MKVAPKFACPHCGGHLSKVLPTRPAVDEHGVPRLRECLDCAGRFDTIETITRKRAKKSPCDQNSATS